MKVNSYSNAPKTYEGGKAQDISWENQLKRLTMTCLLWEDNFYIDGQSQADLIKKICEKVDGEFLLAQAYECAKNGQLRHMPLFLLVQAIRKGAKCKNVINEICIRPDQMTELLSLYWKENGKDKPIAAQLKKGLAKAFTRFDAYQLAKYNRDAPVKLKDVLFLCHPKPNDEKQRQDWKQLIEGTLPIPDTWETRLSSGKDKKATFTELLQENKLGKLALVRNLRNMFQSGVEKSLVKERLITNDLPLLPFQFLMAAKHCPNWEDMIDESMLQSMQKMDKLSGKTVVIVDRSSSMSDVLSQKAESTRMDAACGMAILMKAICEQSYFFSFSENVIGIPARSGMALRDAILQSQKSGGTYLGKALQVIANYMKSNNLDYDRIVVITDEQSHDAMPIVSTKKNYIINVAPYQYGTATNGQWHVINGFSEHVIDYLQTFERMVSEFAVLQSANNDHNFRFDME